MDEIHCLFSIANLYDQPGNNLVCWWPEAPTNQQLVKAITGMEIEEFHLSEELKLLLTNKCQRIGETDYRVEVVKAGEVI